MYQPQVHCSFYALFVCVVFMSAMWDSRFEDDFNGQWEQAPIEARVSVALLVAFVAGHVAQEYEEFRDMRTWKRYLTSKTGNLYDVVILTMQVCVCAQLLRLAPLLICCLFSCRS